MTQSSLLTPKGAAATRADQILAVIAGAVIGAMLAGVAVRNFAFGFW